MKLILVVVALAVFASAQIAIEDTNNASGTVTYILNPNEEKYKGGCPHINEVLIEVDELLTALFPPILNVGASGFHSMGGFRLVVGISQWYDVAHDNIEFAMEGNNCIQNVAGTACVDKQVDQGYTQTLRLDSEVPDDWDPKPNCVRYYNVDVNWGRLWNAGNGGVTRDEDAQNHIVYFRGGVEVTSFRVLVGEIYGNVINRASKEVLLFVLAFPTEVVVRATVTVYAGVEFQMALVTHMVSLDVFELISSATAVPQVKLELKIATTCQMPFRIDPSLFEPSTDMDRITITNFDAAGKWQGFSLEKGNYNDAQCQSGQSVNRCTQIWTINTEVYDIQFSVQKCQQDCTDAGGSCTTYNPTCTDSKCHIEGTFTLTGTHAVKCFGNADCPLDSGTDNYHGSVSFKSSDLCPKTVANVGLKGTLLTYNDDAYSNLDTSFFETNVIYFVSHVETNETAIAIRETALIKCDVLNDQNGNGGSWLYKDGAFGVTGTWDSVGAGDTHPQDNKNDMQPWGPEPKANDPTRLLWHFMLDHHHFPVNRFENKPFTVSCVVEVKFDGINTKKRLTVDNQMHEDDLIHLLQASDDQELATAAEFGIQPIPENGNEQEPGEETTEQATEAQAVILEGKQDSMLIYVVVGVCAVLALLIGGLVMYLRRAGKDKKEGMSKNNIPITVHVTERITATA